MWKFYATHLLGSVLKKKLLGKWYVFGDLIFASAVGIFSIFTTFKLLQEQHWAILHKCFLSAFCRERVITFGYWILETSLGRIFPHCHCWSFSHVVCHLLHHRVLPGISSESEKKPLFGLRGFIFISNNLTKTF